MRDLAPGFKDRKNQFIRSIDIEGLTTLVINLDAEIGGKLVLRTREGRLPNIILAYQPIPVSVDIANYRLTDIPTDPDVLLGFKKYVGRSVVRDLDIVSEANAFHLSHAQFSNVNFGPFTRLSYTANFYKIEGEF
tara:strand:+ start:1724 stop:2128 length:405 start_codon:yes stop_codon:yes gene_type:complete